ncbi:hypothetical protein BCV69DRAFT_298237 [Microstroma glucosiphilum]|uniref:Uncharacterized protein n=1 Tax=Pseudomicrostroma glucosiphilum TaxID=1684307 RepID=A0A316UCB3_9BASI|nr:hypothetical protein BCV69DRAFT_298237 [Pseudomicrostroma glucosiphilum]PWN22043.1 hypothetical protein BCV69DRAFT_298237 [Pseudomicrostroma glucosiphilum]
MLAPKGSGAGGRAAYLLFLTHHLLSSTKQSQLRTWAKDLSLVGLAKRGYPGVILLLASSPSSSSATSSNRKDSPENIGDESAARLEEVARRIKRMQWASQDLRPVQPLQARTFTRLQRVLGERQGSVSETGSDTSAVPKGVSVRRMIPLLFLDTMKEISTLFQEADQLAHPAAEGGGKMDQSAKASQEDSQELWRDIWRREMKPR